MALASTLVQAATSKDQADLETVSHEMVIRLTDQGQILPLERVIDIARDIKPGKMMEASLGRKDQHYIYVIEILDEHDQLWDLLIDAVTGKHLIP